MGDKLFLRRTADQIAPPSNRQITKLLTDDFVHVGDCLNPADGQLECAFFLSDLRRVLSVQFVSEYHSRAVV